MRRLVQPFVAALAAVVALLVMAAPGVAEARWLRAESAHFVIYSDGDEAGLREYVRRLEIYDAVLRSRTGVSADAPTPRKLPIYLVGGVQSMRIIRPDLTSDVGGFYAPSSEHIFAVATRSRNQDWVLFHEYAHHFMRQHFTAAYPEWYDEGFAEYFMTVDIDGNDIAIGRPNDNRGGWLMRGEWLPLERILAGRPSDYAEPEDRVIFYSQAWLLTHWFHSDPERNAQLQAYLTAVNAGEDSVSAIEAATGQTVNTLERRLRSYASGGIPVARAQSSLDLPPVEVTALPAAYDDLLLLSLRLNLGVAEDERDATLRRVREAAARHPADPFARLTLAHAELHVARDRAAAVGLLDALLTEDPANLEALIYMATANSEAAREAEGPEIARLLNASNGYLRRALEVDPDDYRIYYTLAENRVGQPTYPTDNDLETRFMAFRLAPQLPGVRLGLAEALMMDGRFDEAEIALGPLANSPHNSGLRARAAELLALARAGQPPTPRADRAS